MIVPVQGVPAQFDRTAQHRRSMLAKVHIAKSFLGLSDDDYRAVLLRETGRISAKDCTQAELDRLLRYFKDRGFTTDARPRGKSPRADHPVARKARAMWISLALLGAIDDPSEKALESFARRQLGCAKLQWANQSFAYRLIEALKNMAERHGWSQSTEGVRPSAVRIALKRRLCVALIDKLKATGLVPNDWRVERCAFEFAGMEIKTLSATEEELDIVARSLGAVLARHGK